MQTLRTVLKKYVPIPMRLALIKFFNRGNNLSRLIYGKATYNFDGLVTVHNADFLYEPRFALAYKTGKQTNSWPYGDLYWRAYIVCWAAQHALNLEGDFVECGVNRGGYTMTVVQYVNFRALPRRFYLLDTFNGLDERYISQDEKVHGINVDAWDYEECYEAVKESFKDYKNVVLIRGPVPDTLPQVTTDKVSFLSIDMNSRDPEIAAAEYFWDKLVSGAVMVLDDYGWRKHIEQKKAFDEFARQRGVQVLALPTGQGLIFKP